MGSGARLGGWLGGLGGEWLRLLVVVPALLSLCVGAVACKTTRWKTHANYDTSYDFSSVNSFAFTPAREKVAASRSGKLTEEAIRKELTARGYREVASDEARIFISYDIGVYAAAGLGGQNRFEKSEGGITVWFYDPTTMQHVWYGWAETVIHQQDTGEVVIPEAVAALFEDRVPQAPN
ncbi:MAG: DUF4136 domain-containing protein [Deltaproteobacteria bacterium]|nr:DUF4136 domain-containing protein [Deltaproteobacteria bacterium]